MQRAAGEISYVRRIAPDFRVGREARRRIFLRSNMGVPPVIFANTRAGHPCYNDTGIPFTFILMVISGLFVAWLFSLH